MTTFSGGRSVTQTWDGEGRLVRVTTPTSRVDYGYDANGDRVLKRVTGTPLQSLPGAPITGYSDLTIGDLELRGAALSGGSILSYYGVAMSGLEVQLALRPESDSGLLARDPSADRTLHQDYLQSTALVTSADGQVTSPANNTGRLEYGPYGEVIAADAGTATVRQRFNGKQLDETGLADYGARYVDHSLGRWLSRDPAALMDPTAAGQHANLYAFSANNPARYIDPRGWRHRTRRRRRSLRPHRRPSRSY
jgi:RHS repeat-associated protein